MQVSGPKFNNFNFSSSIFLKYFKMRKQNIWDTSIWKWFEGHWKVRLSFQDELGPSPNQGRGGRKRPELFLDKFHQCKPIQFRPVRVGRTRTLFGQFPPRMQTFSVLQCAIITYTCSTPNQARGWPSLFRTISVNKCNTFSISWGSRVQGLGAKLRRHVYISQKYIFGWWWWRRWY